MVQIVSYHNPKLERYVTYLGEFSHISKKKVTGPIDGPSSVDWFSTMICHPHRVGIPRFLLSVAARGSVAASAAPSPKEV
jgi:hypothetical protein